MEIEDWRKSKMRGQADEMSEKSTDYKFVEKSLRTINLYSFKSARGSRSVHLRSRVK